MHWIYDLFLFFQKIIQAAGLIDVIYDTCYG
jgi:hypothetical protein